MVKKMHFIPWLVAMLILVTCLPAAPVSAEEVGPLDFNDAIAQVMSDPTKLNVTSRMRAIIESGNNFYMDAFPLQNLIDGDGNTVLVTDNGAERTHIFYPAYPMKLTEWIVQLYPGHYGRADAANFLDFIVEDVTGTQYTLKSTQAMTEAESGSYILSIPQEAKKIAKLLIHRRIEQGYGTDTCLSDIQVFTTKDAVLESDLDYAKQLMEAEGKTDLIAYKAPAEYGFHVWEGDAAYMTDNDLGTYAVFDNGWNTFAKWNLDVPSRVSDIFVPLYSMGDWEYNRFGYLKIVVIDIDGQEHVVGSVESIPANEWGAMNPNATPTEGGYSDEKLAYGVLHGKVDGSIGKIVSVIIRKYRVAGEGVPDPDFDVAPTDYTSAMRIADISVYGEEPDVRNVALNKPVEMYGLWDSSGSGFQPGYVTDGTTGTYAIFSYTCADDGFGYTIDLQNPTPISDIALHFRPGTYNDQERDGIEVRGSNVKGQPFTEMTLLGTTEDNRTETSHPSLTPETWYLSSDVTIPDDAAYRYIWVGRSRPDNASATIYPYSYSSIQEIQVFSSVESNFYPWSYSANTLSVPVANYSETNADYLLIYSIFDAEGKLLKVSTTPATIPANTTTAQTISTTVEAPAGAATLKGILIKSLTEAGQVVDTFEQSLS